MDSGTIGLCYNFSDTPVSISVERFPSEWLSATGEEPSYNNGELLLPPYTIAIIE